MRMLSGKSLVRLEGYFCDASLTSIMVNHQWNDNDDDNEGWGSDDDDNGRGPSNGRKPRIPSPRFLSELV